MKRSDDSSFWKYMAIYTVVGALSLTMQRLLLLVVVPVGIGYAIYYYRQSKKNTDTFYCWIYLLLGTFFIGVFLTIFEVIPFLAGMYLAVIPFCLIWFMFGIQFWRNGDHRNARIPIGGGLFCLAFLGVMTVISW